MGLKGENIVSKDELALVPVPEKTKTYQPVPHDFLTDTIRKIGDDMLKDFSFHSGKYALAREGAHFFGLHVYKNGGDGKGIGLSIGFRNSYDKSMAIGIAIGANVFVCDNLAFSGDITILRKHTQNVWQDIENQTIQTLYRSQPRYHELVEQVANMRIHELTDDEAYKVLGLVYGKEILSIRQLAVARNQWDNPSFEEFKSRDMWSLYNACTYSLKSSPIINIMDHHILLHDTIVAEMP